MAEDRGRNYLRYLTSLAVGLAPIAVPATASAAVPTAEHVAVSAPASAAISAMVAPNDEELPPPELGFKRVIFNQAFKQFLRFLEFWQLGPAGQPRHTVSYEQAYRGL